MKKLIWSFLLIMIVCGKAGAQQRFIKKATAVNFGVSIQTFSTNDGGWIVFSLDSLKMAKFNRCGQNEWNKKFNIPNTVNGLNDFIQSKNGDFILLTRMVVGNLSVSLITRISAQGNITWCNSYEDLTFSHFPYTVSEDAIGNIFLFANVENIGNNDVYNLISKINANGNLLWTRFYDHGWIWGGALATSDFGLLIRSGSNFIKIDSAGIVQWQSFFMGITTYYYRAIEVSDGYIFTGSTNNGQSLQFYKMNKLGGLLWSTIKSIDIGGSPPRLRKKNNGNIVAAFIKGIGVQSTTTIIEFDKDINIVNQTSIGNVGNNLVGKDICFTTDNYPVLVGVDANNLFVSKLDFNYISSCDAIIPPVIFGAQTVTYLNANTNAFNYALNTINRTYTVDTFSLPLVTICVDNKILELGSDTTVCENVSFTLQNQLADTFETYLWSTGDTTSAITVNQSGIYWLHATYNCSENQRYDTVQVTIEPAPVINMASNLQICIDSTAWLTAPDCLNCSYSWSEGSTSSAIEVSTAGIYWLTIETANGCITADTIEVTLVKCNCDLYVPNAFTPNADGLNEAFIPVYDCDFNQYKIEIFNRWGQLVFASTANTQHWDGSFNNDSAPQGLYVYLINYQPIVKGEIQNAVIKSGTVALVY